ncbi:MAG: IclR family transcriptional regulator [Deltaproteobacteria bacterium]|nr:IclR family transcriptional regulator [Deltaproteobacteria bacterium]MBW2078950.1 IclR family transcriptional regulator [Deltaproteobacteria bacterium]
MEAKKSYRVPALERALDVIDLLASRDRDLPFSEIMHALNIPKPSLARILGLLTQRGLVTKTDERGLYKLGMQLLYLGGRIESKLRLRSVARPHMEELALTTGKTIELSTLDRDQLILIDQIEGNEGVRLFTRIGSAYPYFHAIGAGKIYLAHMERNKRKEVLRKIGLPMVTKHTIANVEQLERELSDIVAKGFAFEDQELREGVRRAVAPIYDSHGKLAGCIGIASPIFSFTYEDKDDLAQVVKGAARKISADMGAATQNNG